MSIPTDRALEFISHNETYAASFVPPQAPPARKKPIIITCMDARVNPYEILGLKTHESIILRNAGGSAQASLSLSYSSHPWRRKDALRSILIAQHLPSVESREIFVIHHTDCGMLGFTSEGMRETVQKALNGDSNIGETLSKIDFLEFNSVEESVKSDVEFLTTNSLIVKESSVTGWVYDVQSGKITQVV